MKTKSVIVAIFLCIVSFVFVSCASSGTDTRESNTMTGSATKTDMDKTDKEEAAKVREKDISAGESVDLFDETASTKKSDTTRGKKDDIKASVSGLQAGFADDNKRFNEYINTFLPDFSYVRHYPLQVNERIILRIKDSENKSVIGAKVKIFDNGSLVSEASSYADGTILFFPRETGNASRFTADISYKQTKKTIVIDTSSNKSVIEVQLDTRRSAFTNVPLDVLFVLDTTGSMGEEIERLKTTIDIINANLVSLSIKPKVRFGLVLYKDRGDEEYITKIVPLSGNLDQFQNELDKVEADGGGDIPEDLQAALDDTMHKIQWASEGVLLSFIITDAPPQFVYEPSYTYVNAVQDARKKGIKMFTVGCGNLPPEGEYVLRQISQYTYAKYIFLTYGESGESQGGVAGSVSHHTGANFQTDKLETIIIKFAKEELAYLSDQPIVEEEDYFEATKVTQEDKKATLSKLFDMAIEQLVACSSIGIEKGTTVSLIPIISLDKAMNLDAEYFTDSFNLSLAQNKTFVTVERKDIQKILDEMELQLSGLVNDESAVKIGEFLGAKMLITGKLYKSKDRYEIFMKLLNVKTAEILSITKTLIDTNLGLSAN